MLAPLAAKHHTTETTGDGPDAARRRLGGLAGPSPVVFLLFKASMTAYYNEIDPYACDWLENLIFCGLIADGVVDRRSIVDVRPSDLAGFTQCHFFAGIGIWSHALRRAGWRDDRPVWTGSCPCQPFSAAGKGGGFDDERHLWPAWHHLIDQRNPSVVLGEQVASKDGLGWLDLVLADLEVSGYSVGAADLCAAGLGAPHIRQRLWFVAPSDDARLERRARAGGADQRVAGPRGVVGGLADADGRDAGAERQQRGGEHGQQQAHSGAGAGGVAYDDSIVGTQGGAFTGGRDPRGNEIEGARLGGSGLAGGLADTEHRADRGEGNTADHVGAQTNRPADRTGGCGGALGGLADDDDAGLGRFAGLRLQGPGLHDADGRRVLGGFWADADWIPCRDGKWRPVEPGTFPLAHGATSRVGRLRAYGNAIVAPVAQAWIEAVMECMP